MRKLTSITSLVSFVLEIITSIVLYIVPHGRVAYWSDWRFWGLSKTQWSNLHINLGVLLLLAIVLHTYYNWNAILAYLKNNNKKTDLLNANFLTACLVSIIFALGTLYELPPFSTILDFSSAIKDRSSKTYGEPPYGHAELSSLKIFTEKMKLNLNESTLKLERAGIKITSQEQTLAEIAVNNNTSPSDIYKLIKPEEKTMATLLLPESPPAGFGHNSLAEICSRYNLDQENVLNVLAAQGFPATPEMTLKAVGEQYSRNPHDIYQFIYETFRDRE